MKLIDISTIKTGKNLSRWKDTETTNLSHYSYDDLIQDLNGYSAQQNKLDSQKSNEKAKIESNINDYSVNIGDVVFSFVSSTAGIVSEATDGKVLNQNFAKILIKVSKVDARYLCYCLNQSSNLKKQMAIEMQGSTLPKLTPASLKELDIPLPDISKQRLIGKAYFSLLRRQFLLEQKANQEEKLVLTLLEQ